jgi:hypothetical protein
VAQGRVQWWTLVNTVLYFWVSERVGGNFLTSGVIIIFSRMTLLHIVGWLAGRLVGCLVS